jgi:hypothetical protein
MRMLSMLLNATRSACVVVLVTAAAATGCGQDLDLGPITGRDGLTLPPPGASSTAGSTCPVETAAAVPLPTRCFVADDISWTQTDEGKFEYQFISEACLVTGDGRVTNQTKGLTACPMGVYWKFAQTPWRHNGPPLPADGAFPTAEAFERSIAIYRGDQTSEPLPGPTAWRAPFASEGWQTVPRSVQVLPERQAVFIRFDPRPSTGQRFVVFFSVPELSPDAVELRADPEAHFWALDIAPGTAATIE